MINSITGKVSLRSFQLNGSQKITLDQEIKSLVDGNRVFPTRLPDVREPWQGG